MKKKYLVVIFTTITLIISSCTRNEYRYEAIQSSESEYTRTLLVDKKVGTVWILTTEGKWLNVGVPPEGAPEKGDELKIKD
ncbi:MAG: hypothetical protein K9I29_10075 [Bacteroidales bacterium]|nr:hypothetical protein [Bacteroidales bacterium]MCF8328628.1 hypothetical protein [Bacteroidales bacterium]